jgi:hypothetical protein
MNICLFHIKTGMDVNQYVRKNTIEHTIGFFKSFKLSSLFSHINTILLRHVLIWTIFRFQVQYDMVFISLVYLFIHMCNVYAVLLYSFQSYRFTISEYVFCPGTPHTTNTNTVSKSFGVEQILIN